MELDLERLNINIPGNEYDVLIARNLKNNVSAFLANHTKNRDIMIVTDDYFAKGYALELKNVLEVSGFTVLMYVMRGGKTSKSFNEVLKIYGELETHNFARDATMIAMGGGVIGDLAGFVSSTWYRGMNLIHIPSTLMAMVDSSIGGKVAINFRETINAVGNYYHPIANFMDLEMIDSLPQRDYVSGLAEVIKCALIADVDLIDYLNKHRAEILNNETVNIVHCIRRAIEIKVDHVRNDVKECGKRLLLNYGHTLGHAIETATHTEKSETFRHGEGVSLGISAVLSISHSYLGLDVEVADEVRSLLESFMLPVSFSASEHGYDRLELIDLCMKLVLKDKKRKDNQLRFVLIDRLGHADVHTGISSEQIQLAFVAVIKD